LRHSIECCDTVARYNRIEAGGSIRLSGESPQPVVDRVREPVVEDVQGRIQILLAESTVRPDLSLCANAHSVADDVTGECG